MKCFQSVTKNNQLIKYVKFEYLKTQARYFNCVLKYLVTKNYNHKLAKLNTQERIRWKNTQ